MNAKATGLIALGTMSVGILVGFIVGILTQPRGFNATGMFAAWGVFGFISLALVVISGVLKNQEILNEQNKPSVAEEDDNADSPIPHVVAESNNSSVNPNQNITALNNENTDIPAQQEPLGEVVDICENCGNEIREGEEFCSRCATPVSAHVE